MPTELATPSDFPAALAEDSGPSSAYQAAQFHLRQGLQALANLPPDGPPEQRAAHAEILSQQQQILQRLQTHFAPEPTATATRRFGEVLRQQRAAAGLTQKQLAAQSQLSLSLIRKLEQGSTPPSRHSLLSLCSVADLKLLLTEWKMPAAARGHGLRPARSGSAVPGFDSVRIMSDLAQQISSGSIEQTYVYLDHQSARDWLQLCNTPSYVATFRQSMPHSAVAQRLREVVGSADLDVIALGPGDGKSEVLLVQRILHDAARRNIRLYLLDASQPLLSCAFKHAVDTFNDDPRVFVCAIQGNFHHLPRYLQLHYQPAHSQRRRVFLLLGNTLGNIDNEPQFLQSAFSEAAPGDLLIFDADYTGAPSSDPADIRKAEPTLSRPIPDSHQRWLAGTIKRHCPDVQDIRFSLRLDTNRPLAGSYGLQFVATVTFPGNRIHTFPMFNVRRYEPSSIVQCMRGLDWEAVGQIPFTGSKAPRKGVFLFQKRNPSKKPRPA